MKFLAESRGIQRLNEMRTRFAEDIRGSYEHRAKPCSTCETPGICCRDEHFVNVRVTRLEAAAIVRRLDELPGSVRDAAVARAAAAAEKYGLDGSDDTAMKTYACPLFEKGTGCLVHDAAKPLPCIAHACYEREADLPPDELLEEREAMVAELNRRVYGSALTLPIPVAIARSRRPSDSGPQPPAEDR